MATPCCCACGKPSTIQCSVCNSADYCSPRCKNNDSDSHRQLCRAFVDFTSNKPKPIPKCVLALYFPIMPFQTRGGPPRFIWFDGTNEVTKDEVTGTVKKVHCLASPSKPNPQAKGFEIFANYVNEFESGHTIVFHMRSAFRSDGSRTNVSLIETAKGQVNDAWAGPLAVYCRNGLGIDSNRVDRDFSMSDFRTFMDFCKTYGEGPGSMIKHNMWYELEVTNPNLLYSALSRDSGGTVCKGVEISCKGDTRVLGLEKFRGVDVPVNHPIWDTLNLPTKATKASELLGLPLKMRKVFPDARLAGNGFRVLDNDEAAHLDLETDCSHPRWGMSAPGDGMPRNIGVFGRVLVVRNDGKDISPNQVEAVVSFFRQEVVPRICWIKLGGHEKGGVQECVIDKGKLMSELVSQGKFEEFFEDLKRKKVRGGATSWENELSPYGVGTSRTDGDELVQQLSELSVKHA